MRGNTDSSSSNIGHVHTYGFRWENLTRTRWNKFGSAEKPGWLHICHTGIRPNWHSLGRDLKNFIFSSATCKTKHQTRRNLLFSVSTLSVCVNCCSCNEQPTTHLASSTVKIGRVIVLKYEKISSGDLPPTSQNSSGETFFRFTRPDKPIFPVGSLGTWRVPLLFHLRLFMNEFFN